MQLPQGDLAGHNRDDIKMRIVHLTKWPVKPVPLILILEYPVPPGLVWGSVTLGVGRTGQATITIT